MAKEILPVNSASDQVKATIHNLIQRVGIDNVADWSESKPTDLYKFSNPKEPREIPVRQALLLSRRADQAGHRSLARLFHSEKSRLIDARYGRASGEINERIASAHQLLGQIQGLARAGDALEAFSLYEELDTVMLDIRAELSAMDSKFGNEE